MFEKLNNLNDFSMYAQNEMISWKKENGLQHNSK